MNALLLPWLRPDDTALAAQDPDGPMVIAPCVGFLCVVAGDPVEALIELSPVASVALLCALTLAAGWLALT